MIKKKYLLLFLCLIMFVTNVSRVNADVVDIGAGTEDAFTDDNGGTGGNGGGTNNNPWHDARYGDRKIMYRYRVGYKSRFRYQVSDINPNGSIIKSGTWIGINAREIQTASWSVSNFEFKEIRTEYTCTTTTKGQPACGKCYKDTITNKKLCPGMAGYVDWKGCGSAPTITTTKSFGQKSYYTSFNCPDGGKASYVEKEVSVSTAIAETFKNAIYKNAHDTALGFVGAPLSSIQITTDELDSNNKYKTLTIGVVEVESSDTGVAASGTIIKKYEYKPNNICINLKTGKVSYNKTCQTDEEVQVLPYYSGGLAYWQYFSPLDMKSGSNFKLEILGGRQLNEKECEGFRNKYGGNAGNYIDSSCRLRITSSYNVVQKYYYEETKNNKLVFNGYNLYYRPININNPFPTIPTSNSLWYKWYNSKDKSPNLKDSFNEVTYSVDVPNKLADTIRAYNVNNPYPSFDKLSLSGTSDFLRSIGVEALTKDKKYGLGGGTRTCVKNGTVSIGSDCS